LELELLDGSFLTIRRAVENATKVSFSLAPATQPDLTSLADDDWSHFELPFAKAKSLLDGYLDLRDIDPWKFRNAIGYFLRTQADYDDVSNSNATPVSTKTGNRSLRGSSASMLRSSLTGTS